MSGKSECPDFWVGQSIELQNAEGDIFYTQIVRTDDKLIYIRRPASKKAVPMPVEDDMSVSVIFYDDFGTAFTFKTKFRFWDNRLAVGKPASHMIQRVQRRRFFRVPAELKMRIAPLNSGDADNFGKIVMKTRDLSGGGLSFSSPYGLEEDTPVDGTLFLKTNTLQRNIKFSGTIVKCGKDRNLFRVSLEFTELKEADRAAIIKFCLFKQIELRNKLRNYPL